MDYCNLQLIWVLEKLVLACVSVFFYKGVDFLRSLLHHSRTTSFGIILYSPLPKLMEKCTPWGCLGYLLHINFFSNAVEVCGAEHQIAFLWMEILFWIHFWMTLLKCTFSIPLEILNLNILPFCSTSPSVNISSSTLLNHLIKIIIKSKCSHYLLFVSNFIKCFTCIISFDVHNNFVWLLLCF